MKRSLVSRRAFLKSGGALTLSIPLLGKDVFASQIFKAKTQKTCVVIGAGLAGLAAAYRLQRSGWKVMVIEARPRIGGRVWTHRDSQSRLAFELGGEWISGNHTRMMALCHELNLPLQSGKVARAPSREYSRQAQDGWRNFSAAWPKYSDRDWRNLDRTDWWTRLSRIGYSQNDLRVRDANDSADFGESIRQVSAYAAAKKYLETSPGIEEKWKIRDGNDCLTRALAARIGHQNFRLQTNVTAVTQKKGEIFVQAGNEILRADACVCTVPARVLNQNRFAPELPQAQVKAAWELQYARIVKSAVVFEKPFWKGGDFAFEMNAALLGYFYSAQSQSDAAGVLVSCAVGDKADVFASQSASLRQKKVVRDLENFDERAPRLARDIVSQAWQRDPFSQGAYALYRPGQWFSIRPILQQPHGKILFAGEHLANFQGSMEGAIETGERAADELRW